MPLDTLPPISSHIPKKHSSWAIAEARKIQKEFPFHLLEKRIPVSGITIDSLISPDLDDGIHIEKIGKKWKLFVSIASPTEIIDPQGAIELEVFRRATSVYFWEGHIYHMLPNIISTNIASLNHQTHRFALTLEITLDADFQVLQSDIYQSNFFNRQRHDPKSFTQGITNTAHGEYEYFSLMHELARWLRQTRENDMRIDNFDDADRRITMGEKILGHSNTHISSFVIQEFMICANRECAKIMKESGIQGLYRLHMPEYEWITDLPKILDRAEYSATPWFHRGLGLPLYMHFTSPIRRLADYFSHRAIIALLEGKSQPQNTQEIANHTNMQVTAMLGHQKEELLDQHGKRIIRRGQRNGARNGLDKNLKQHVEYRVTSGLRTPKSIREKIIQDIKSTEYLEDWIIKRFLLSNEYEIKQALKQRILSDPKTKRYVSLLNQVEGISLRETIIFRSGIPCLQIIGYVGEEKFSRSIRLTQMQINTRDHFEAHRKVIIQKSGKVYVWDKEYFLQAKISVRKKAFEKIFDEIM